MIPRQIVFTSTESASGQPSDGIGLRPVDRVFSVSLLARLAADGRFSLRVAEFSRALGIGTSSAWDLIRRGEIETVRFGAGRRKLTVIPISAVEAFIARNRVPAREVRGAQP